MFASRSSERDDGSVEADMRAFGAPESEIDKWRQAAAQREKREAIEVHADNWETVQLFDALHTQWRTAGMAGVRVGLDYGAVAPTAQAMGIELSTQRFQEIRLMEASALKQIGENRRKEEQRSGQSGGKPKKKKGKRRD